MIGARLLLLLAFTAIPRPARADVAAAIDALSIEPNSEQDVEHPMRVRVTARPPQAEVKVSVLQDCNLDGIPDHDVRGRCPPLGRWTWNLDDRGALDAVLDFREHKLPTNKNLWLEVCPGPDKPGACRVALFFVSQDPCGLLDTLIHAFVPNARCNLKLHMAFGNRRGDTAVRRGVFEVRILEPSREAPPSRRVAGTKGATGVAWSREGSLLVSIGRDVANATIAAGLYELSSDGTKRAMIWAAPAEAIPRSPLALSSGKVAVILERNAGPRSIALIQNGRLLREIEVFADARWLRAASAGESAILAEAAVADRWTIVRVDLATGAAIDLGYSGGVRYALGRSPASSLAVLTTFDASGRHGSDVDLYDENGIGVFRLASSERDEWMPVWRPDGSQLAYLSAD